MNEAQTEFDLIDPALKKAGWGEVEGSRVRKQFPISQGRLLGSHNRRAQPLKADYVLQYKNRNLAVIEAKARDEYYTSGVAQAKDYAEKLDARFTYSTNGLRIYGIDMEEGKEGDVESFPGPEELWARTYPPPVNVIGQDKATWREKLFAIPYETISGTMPPRYYQVNAVTRTLEAIADGKERILLTLATGTGKTAIAFQIAWKLFAARWNLRRDGLRLPRILFLADRNILANQAFSAFNAFNAFEENALVRISPDEIRKKGKVPKNGSIFFTIFQTFMSGPGDTPYFGDYPKDFFDLIIIDECHRGGANDESQWREIMKYFSPAVQLGLTATPKRDVNKDTYEYFGKPVYIYSLKDGINDGFLTPFKVREIATTGDTYRYTSDDKIIEGEIEEGREYTLEEQNRIIELMDVEKFRVQTFMKEINQNHKTLVFCATQVHAAAIRDLINQVADSKNTNYCCRVTADDGERGEKYLRDFQNNEKTIPTILTTSQKLSTGVDAQDVRNIVLLRPVNSIVEFKQIIGRGTRLFDGKDYFTIYDFVKAHKHFQDKEWDGEPIEPEGGPVESKVCQECDQKPCVCSQEEKPEPENAYCETCSNDPCVCEPAPKYMIRVKLSDNKIRELDSMAKTSFWSPSGKPISHSEFVEQLFGDLPAFFKNEAELRQIWSLPETRKKLLSELSEKGYSDEQLQDLSKLVHGEDSDLFDVLSYIAWQNNMIPRKARADKALTQLADKKENYNENQREFLEFVLAQYVKEGVSELDDAKLPKILELKYKALADAKAALGEIKSIREIFIGFQGHLYE